MCVCDIIVSALSNADINGEDVTRVSYKGSNPADERGSLPILLAGWRLATRGVIEPGTLRL